MIKPEIVQLIQVIISGLVAFITVRTFNLNQNRSKDLKDMEFKVWKTEITGRLKGIYTDFDEINQEIKQLKLENKQLIALTEQIKYLTQEIQELKLKR